MFYTLYLPDHFEFKREGQFNFLIKASVTGLFFLFYFTKMEMVNSANIKHNTLFALFGRQYGSKFSICIRKLSSPWTSM